MQIVASSTSPKVSPKNIKELFKFRVGQNSGNQVPISNVGNPSATGRAGGQPGII